MRTVSDEDITVSSPVNLEDAYREARSASH